jgi:hypothetical protein
MAGSGQDARGPLAGGPSTQRLGPGGGNNPFASFGKGASAGQGGVGPAQAQRNPAAPGAGNKASQKGNGGGKQQQQQQQQQTKYVSAREEGVVRTLRDAFGFIACTSDPKFGDVYFRLEDVIKPKAGKKGPQQQQQVPPPQPPVMALGVRVEFAVDLNNKTGEYRAAKVKILAANTANTAAQQGTGMSSELVSFKPSWAASSNTNSEQAASGGAASGAAHPSAKPAGLRPSGGGGGPSPFAPLTSFGPGGGWGGGASGGGASAAAAAPKHHPAAAAEAARAEIVATLFGGGLPGSKPSGATSMFGQGKSHGAPGGGRGVTSSAGAAAGGPPGGSGPPHQRSGSGSGLAHGTGPPLVSSLETGVVIALKEAFGFIRCTSAPQYGDVFFRFEQAAMFDASTHGSIASVLPPGTEVEFAVEANSSRAGEYRALRVRFPGTGAATAAQAPHIGSVSGPGGGGGAGAPAGGRKAKTAPGAPADANGGAASGRGKHGEGGGYSAFHDTRSMLGWLAKRGEEPAGCVLLTLSNFQAPLDDICSRSTMPPAAIRGVLALLAGPGVRRSVLREKADALYLRTLKSPLVTSPSNLGAYIRGLPSSSGGPSVYTEAFTSLGGVLDEWLARCPEEAATSLPWADLRVALRSASLPMALEEQLSTLLHKAAQVTQSQAGGSGGGDGAQPDAEHLSDDTSDAGPSSTPADFRHMPVFPSAEEILGAGGPPDLRPNIVDGHYDNALQYLDTHFRLLREDCLAPLRDGVRAYLGGEASTDVRAYPGCQLVGLHCGRDGVFYRVSFRLPPGTSVEWERSKRLMYGSLLLLSADGFRGTSLLWATVANRDPALCSARGGLVDIRFPDGHEARFAPGVSYTIVESAATYFEAYRHVLAALQAVAGNPQGLPFADTLLRCKTAVEAPSYLRRPGADKYVLPEVFPDLERQAGRSAVHILQEWPQPGDPGCPVTSSLDSSQLAAVKLALTRQVALIQGPPGTGKTFVGLKVVHTLLLNYRARVAQGAPKPVLVVTMTNHALDQFLEGILGFEPNVIRVGSRSRSDVLAGCNLRDRAFEAGRAAGAANQARKGLIGRMRDLERGISQLVAELNSRELSVEELEACAGWDALASLRDGGPPGTSYLPDEAKLRAWLQPVQEASATAHKAAADALAAKEAGLDVPEPSAAGGAPRPSGSSYRIPLPDPKPAKPRGGAFGRGGGGGAPSTPAVDEEASVAMDEDEEDTLDVDASGRVVNAAVRERMLDDEPLLSGDGGASMLSLAKLSLGDEDDDVGGDGHLDDAALLACDDVWALPPKARGRLYALWKAAACGDAAAELADACGRYERLARERKELDESNQLAALAGAAVIGMTTTGLAKYQKLVGALECEVVVVEEAAEVLEAHIVAALGPATKHLILIGDHLQLRPGTAVYALAKRYNLDVSMFERLVRNGVEHVTLARQRRMRPAIARLLAPVYPALHDHPDVERYPGVPGMAAPLWFFTHTHGEAMDSETRSRSNAFEASMTHALAVHLLRSGMAPGRITVLATYCGQLFALRKKFRAAGGETGLDEIRLCSVDQYQGEENDVILLSLVRSNSAGDIGFLSVQNRMVVALSRARHGMFILGNADLLAKRSALWRGVVEQLRASGCVASTLPCLAGPRPGSQRTVQVSQPTEFGQVMAAGYPSRPKKDKT